MRKPRALRPGDRIALVAPASAFVRAEFDAGVNELKTLGFEPVYEESVFERRAYAAGSARTRAAAFARAWLDPKIAALIAVRGGYGSVHLLPLLDMSLLVGPPKAFVGFSDNTSLLSWLTLTGRIVSFHGPIYESLTLLATRVGFTDVRVTTPGQLDVELVATALENGEISRDELGPFLTRVVTSRVPIVAQQFQRFLQEAGLSSSMMMVAQRPGP